MDFDSTRFLVFAALCLLVFHTLGKTRFRPCVFLVANCCFLYSFFQSWAHATPLLCFILIGYGLVWLAQRGLSERGLITSVISIVGLFVYLKKYSLVGFLPFLEFPYSAIGMSYILFRILQLIIDIKGGLVNDRVSILDYLNFTCFFLGLVSGPIQSYQNYKEQDEASWKSKITEDEAYYGIQRIILGYLKIIFFAQVFQVETLDYENMASIIEQNQWLACLWFSLKSVLFSIFLYVNFSGYMDVVVGVGRLFSFRVSENFNKPFAATNFIEFWSRWHITLSNWFQVYFFNPIVKALTYRFPNPALSPYHGVVGFFVTFFVLGLWHGSTWIFFAYGGLLGLGVSVNKLYQVRMRKWLKKKGYNKLKENSFYTYFCRGLTFSYFSIAIASFWFTIDQLNIVFGMSAVPVLGGILVVLGGLSAVAFGFYDVIVSLTRDLRAPVSSRFSESYLLRNLWLSAQVFLVIYLFISNLSPTPDFVYEAF